MMVCFLVIKFFNREVRKGREDLLSLTLVYLLGVLCG